MTQKKKTVFLTGATGNMGSAGLRELLCKKDRFQIRILARDSRVNRRKLAPYADEPAVEIIWGDLCRYEDVLKGVSGADYVLHVGGMVSPAADYFPEKTLKVNVTSAENIVRAVLAQPDPDSVKVVYIGSVAEFGDRRKPFHWGRCSDPVVASRYDMYSVSKCLAEKTIVDSGIKYWVSLRQSGILYPGILKVVNPTAFHVPVGGVLEWATIEDSGRLLANVVEDDVPEEFWRRFYNISSGEQFRMTNYEFESRLLGALGLPSPEKVFRPEWFALKNFHGMWYTDADLLENYLHFRENITIDAYFARMKKSLPWYYSLAFLAPGWAVKMFMKPYAFEEGMGTQWWVKNNEEKFLAYYGSREAYEAIRSWDDVRPAPLEKNLRKAIEAGEVRLPELGWDSSRDIYSLSEDELQAAAAFRGGRYLGRAGVPAEDGTAAPSGSDGTAPEAVRETSRSGADLRLWESGDGLRFEASLEYVLLGGGWMTRCGYDRVLSEAGPGNRFVTQLRTGR